MAEPGEVERMIAAFDAAIGNSPDYPLRLIDLAEQVVRHKAPLRALELVRQALARAPGDARAMMRARTVAARTLPSYHVGMMNDTRRNLAWDAALRRAIGPGMHVLEIGTGAGMLAMMAARAGAGRVTTCEIQPVAAQMARELAALNGYADRIRVIGKKSADLRLGEDLERPADLLFCDIFGDNLVIFDPLTALADARRLLKPGAPVVPAFGAIKVALAHHREFARLAHIDRAAGFDLSPMAPFVAASVPSPVHDPAVTLMSAGEEAFRFDFAAASHPTSNETEIVCRASRDGAANVILQWIRLELDAETVLEAKPDPAARFFSQARFYPLVEPVSVRAGERLRIGVAYRGRKAECWLAGRG